METTYKHLSERKGYRWIHNSPPYPISVATLFWLSFTNGSLPPKRLTLLCLHNLSRTSWGKLPKLRFQFSLTPCPEKNRIEVSTAKWKGDSTWQGKYVAPHIAANQGRNSMRLETPKAVSKIFRPMSEHTERTWPIGVERRRLALGPRSPNANCQFVIGHKIVHLGGDLPPGLQSKCFSYQ